MEYRTPISRSKKTLFENSATHVFTAREGHLEESSDIIRSAEIPRSDPASRESLALTPLRLSFELRALLEVLR